MKFTNNVGMILLSIYLILVGVVYFGVAIPSVILGVLAIAAGVLILIGR